MNCSCHTLIRMDEMVRRVAVLVWLGLSLVQFVVWGLICIIGGRLVEPWFLWTVGVGAVVVGALSLLTTAKGGRR
jgi:hypothetical protein